MSNEAQGLVRNLPMEAPHKPILMAYANYADEAGYCWPGVETIAFDTGYSVPTVVRVRRDLIKGNWLRSKRRFGTSAGTRLNLAKIAAEGVDRGDRTKVKPEFEFEDETPVQPQSDQADLNGNSSTQRTDQSDLNEQISLISTTDQADHLSISPLSVDPSVEAQAPTERQKEQTKKEAQPPEWALRMVLDWDYGRHRRPTARQANELARLVEAAHRRGLSRIEIKRHGQATLNAAVKSGVSYLMGGLSEEHLPAIPPPPPGPSVAEASGTRRSKENGSREHQPLPYSSEEGRRRARELFAVALAAKRGVSQSRCAAESPLSPPEGIGRRP